MNISGLASATITDFNLDESYAKYKKSDKYMGFANIKVGKKPFVVTLKGQITTNGIAVGEYEDKTEYSIGFRFDDESELETIKAFEGNLALYGKGEYTVFSKIKDNGSLFLKLKLNKEKNAFACTSNEKLDPKNPTAMRVVLCCHCKRTTPTHR